MTRITGLVALTALLLVTAPLTALAGRCPHDCKNLLKSERETCRVVCPKHGPGKDCRSACFATFKGDKATCRAAVNPMPPGCGSSTTTTTATSSTTSTTICVATSGTFCDRGDGTIFDSATGLQWEQKTATAGLRNVNNVYSWAGICDLGPAFSFCQPNAAAAATCAAQAEGGTFGCSTCASGACKVDVQDYTTVTTVWDWVNQVNAANFAGHNDWRLPSEGGNNYPSTGANELETILLAPYPCATHLCVNSIFGPTSGGPYWSASSFSHADPADPSYQAWTVRLDDGFVSEYEKPEGYHGRAVRGGS